MPWPTWCVPKLRANQKLVLLWCMMCMLPGMTSHVTWSIKRNIKFKLQIIIRVIFNQILLPAEKIYKHLTKSTKNLLKNVYVWVHTMWQILCKWLSFTEYYEVYRNASLFMKLSNLPSVRVIQALIASQ